MTALFTDGELGLVIDFGADDADYKLARHLFERGKKFIEAGGEIEIPIYAIVGIKPIDGRPETKGSIVVIDQDQIHVEMYKKDQDRYHQAMAMKAERIGAFMMARMSVSPDIPEADYDAWENRDLREHPDHWEQLEVSIANQLHPDRILRMRGKIEQVPNGRHISQAVVEVASDTEEELEKAAEETDVGEEDVNIEVSKTPTFGLQFRLPANVNPMSPEARYAFGNGLFNKIREFINGGGVIYIPLFAIIGRRLVTGDVNRGKDILVIDQTAKNIASFSRKGIDPYNAKIMALASYLDAVHVARIAEICCVPPEDEEAWKDKPFGKHPNHWHELVIEVQSEAFPAEIITMTSRITVGATCRFVEDPKIVIVQKANRPVDKSLQ